MKEITDEQRSVLQIKTPDGDLLYYNSFNYVAVSNPYLASRYAPLDDEIPSRKEDRDSDMKYIKNCFAEEFEIQYVPYVDAYENYKSNNKEDYGG